MIEKAYAKINLSLDVTGRLENGYHLVKMILQTVDIYDELTFEKAEKGIVITTDNGELPTDESNLIYKAVKVLFESCGVTEGIRIHLEKRIPIAAGMAGGSSDAAATLRAVNKLYQLGKTTGELQDLAVKIGADVPYCVVGGTVLAEGIGEVLTTLPACPAFHIVVAKPREGVSTKYVYETLDSLTEVPHPDVDGMIQAIEANDKYGITSRLGNVLECVTIPALPVIDRIKTLIKAQGAEGVLMSGSGPTVFGLFSDKGAADKAYEACLKDADCNQVFLTELIRPAYSQT